MYVADMTMEDAQATLRELRIMRGDRRRQGLSDCEPLDWDIEDVEGRIVELGGDV